MKYVQLRAAKVATYVFVFGGLMVGKLGYGADMPPDFGVECQKVHQLVEKYGRQSLPEITKRLNDSSFVIRAAALKALSEKPFTCEDVESLVGSSIESPIFLIKNNAVQALANHGCDHYKLKIGKMMSSEKNNEVRKAFINYFSRVGDGGDVPFLRQIQNDVNNDLSVRLLSAKAIAVLGGKFDEALVNSAFLLTEDYQKAAIRVLAFSSNQANIPRLEPFLNRRDQLRDEARVAIGRISIIDEKLSTSEKETRLFQYLDDDSDRVQFWAAEQLIGISGASQSIITKLEDIATNPQHKAFSATTAALISSEIVTADELNRILMQKNPHE